MKKKVGLLLLCLILTLSLVACGKGGENQVEDEKIVGLWKAQGLGLEGLDEKEDLGKVEGLFTYVEFKKDKTMTMSVEFLGQKEVVTEGSWEAQGDHFKLLLKDPEKKDGDPEEVHAYVLGDKLEIRDKVETDVVLTYYREKQ